MVSRDDATTVFDQARAACAHLCNPGQMRRQADMLTRAQLMHAVIRSRARFQPLLDRSVELRSALARFRGRRSAACR